MGGPNQPDGNVAEADYAVANTNSLGQWDDDKDDSARVGDKVDYYFTEYGTSTDGISETFSSIQSSQVVFTQKRYLSDATIAAIPAYTYTGNALEPTLNIDYYGASLVRDRDYIATFTNNISSGTASVTITGTGSYTGTNSTTFQIVELTPPNAANIPANTSDYAFTEVTGTYSLTGYDATATYKASVVALGSASATFNIKTNTGLSLDSGYSSWEDISVVNFKGTSANIENALNSIELNTTNEVGGEIQLRVFITTQIANTFFNPINGHIYEYISGTTRWDDAKSAAASRTYEDEPGYLVTITSSVEQNYINTNVDGSNLWIGLTDEDVEGTWKWVTGPESGREIWSGDENGSAVGGNYTNWASGQPDGLSGEHYVGAKFVGGTGWNDFEIDNGDIQGYIVEYGTWTDGLGLTFRSSQKSEVVFTQIPQGVSISSTASNTTDEDGSNSVDVEISLTINPLGDVTVPLSSSDVTEGQLSVAQVTFTKDNWNVSQTITVSGIDDELFDGDIQYQLVTGDTASTADTNYNNLGASDVEDITLTNQDNDGISVTINSMVDCFGSNEGAATVSVNSSNTGAYTYSWDSNPVQTSNQAVDLIAGAYIVTVTDAQSNSITQTITITEPTDLLVQTAFTAATNISGYLQATVSGGTPPYSYSWNDGQTTSTTTEIFPADYKVIVTDANSCSTSSTITVNKATPVITFNDITTTFGDPDFDLSATSSSTGLYSFSIADSNVATVDGNTVSIKGTGTTIVTASQVSDTNYLAATATMTLTVEKATPVITFNDITKTFGDPDFDLSATSSSTGALYSLQYSRFKCSYCYMAIQ